MIVGFRILRGLVTASVLIAGVTTASDYTDGIAAIVNDEVITVFQVVRESRPFESQLANRFSGKQLQEKIAELRQQIAKQMVESRLVFAEFEDRGHKLPPDFIERNLDRIVESEAGGSWDRFEAMLEEDGTTLAQFRDRLRRRLAVDLMLEEMVRRPVKAAPEEINNFYQNNLDKFTRPGRLRLQVIFVKRASREVDAFDARVKEVSEKLAKGAAFGDLAKAMSDDVSAERGGDVGWVDTRTGKREFIDAVADLSLGGISAPVDLDEGVYFLKLLESSKPEVVPLDDTVREQVKVQILRMKQQQRYEELLGQLRKKFFVKTFF